MEDERLRRCCFAGHSSVYDADISSKIKNAVIPLIEEHGVTDFCVGNYGQFDHYAASVIRELQKEYPQISVSLVIPYLTKDINEYKELYAKNYNSILMADIPEGTPRNLKIIKANQYMVDWSAHLVCYINQGCGGAAKTYEYALKKKIDVINIGSYCG